MNLDFMQQEERVVNDILHVAVKVSVKENIKGTTYIPPKPHLRPAFDRGKEKFENNIKNL